MSRDSNNNNRTAQLQTAVCTGPTILGKAEPVSFCCGVAQVEGSIELTAIAADCGTVWTWASGPTTLVKIVGTRVSIHCRGAVGPT